MNEKLSEIEKCFSVIGFKRAEVESIYKILSAILHLGDIKIEADITQEHMNEVASISKNDEVLKFGESACKLRTRRLPCLATHTGPALVILTPLSGRPYVVATLMTVSPREVRKALTTTTVMTQGETIQKSMTIEQTLDARDAMAKVHTNYNVHACVSLPLRVPSVCICVHVCMSLHWHTLCAHLLLDVQSMFVFVELIAQTFCLLLHVPSGPLQSPLQLDCEPHQPDPRTRTRSEVNHVVN